MMFEFYSLLFLTAALLFGSQYIRRSGGGSQSVRVGGDMTGGTTEVTERAWIHFVMKVGGSVENGV